jgi:hypothetical protein
MKVTTPRPPVLLLLGSKTTAHQIGIRARPSEPRSSRVWQAGPSRRDKKQTVSFPAPKLDGTWEYLRCMHGNQIKSPQASQPAALPAGPQSAGVFGFISKDLIILVIVYYGASPYFFHCCPSVGLVCSSDVST